IRIGPGSLVEAAVYKEGQVIVPVQWVGGLSAFLFLWLPRRFWLRGGGCLQVGTGFLFCREGLEFCPVVLVNLFFAFSPRRKDPGSAPFPHCVYFHLFHAPFFPLFYQILDPLRFFAYVSCEA